MASLVTPALTTIRQPLAEIGERATRMLIARIEGDTAGEPAHRMASELVVRGTTAPAPA
jgi:LacI family transcriptional regulator